MCLILRYDVCLITGHETEFEQKWGTNSDDDQPLSVLHQY